jgi:hypothetical protein
VGAMHGKASEQEGEDKESLRPVPKTNEYRVNFYLLLSHFRYLPF